MTYNHMLEMNRELREKRAARNARRRRNHNFMFAVAASLGVVLFFVAFPVVAAFYDRDVKTTIVVSKERVCDASGSGESRTIDCKYLIFTDAGTYKIVDSLFGVTRFNSSDVYGKVREGQCYEITVYGWRLPAFSTYENVAKIVPSTACQ